MNETRRLCIACLIATLWLGCGDDDSTPSRPGKDGGAQIIGGARGNDDDDGGVDPEADFACDDEDAGGCPPGKHCGAGLCVWDSCGDGIVNGTEECDDGNELTGDDCNPGCKLVSPRCMDGMRQEDEECDDGNFFHADACSNSCTLNECGNARMELDEECDDGNSLDADGCSNECTENRCRNGRLDPGEECDDGNQDHHDGCTNACMIVACGNGELEEDEECDDGNEVDDDDCANLCTANECGNLRVDPGEVCDGTSATMGCSDDCQQVQDNSACLPCIEANCRYYDFVEYDYVQLCFENEDPALGALCQDAMACAFGSECLKYDGTDPVPCICTDTPSNCQMPNFIHGACYDAFYEASQAKDIEDFLRRQNEGLNPAGWAYYLLQCVRAVCQSDCGGQP